MSFFNRRKTGPQEIMPENEALSLPPAYGSAEVTFSGKVVHSLRRMITKLAYADELPKRIALVSALREEGVTYTTLAMGTTIASDLDKTVCVVELNWWWPGMTLQVPDVNSRGVAAVLAGEATLDDVIVPTGLPNLRLLPAGEMPVEKRPIMARNAALKELINNLSKRYDYLLLDVPAILTTSDAISLASLADGCCLVIRQGVTSVEKVNLALDDIDHLNILGAIMNQVKVKTPSLLLKFIPQD